VAATFGFVWLRRQKRWASIVAIIALVFAAAQFLIGDNFMNRWPIFILALGVFMLVKALVSNKNDKNVNQQKSMQE